MSAKQGTEGTESSVPNSWNRELNGTTYSSQLFIFNKSLIYKAYWTRNYITYSRYPSIDLYGNAGSFGSGSTHGACRQLPASVPA